MNHPERDKSESVTEDTHIGEIARIDGFSGNLDNAELEDLENFDPSQVIMEEKALTPLTKDFKEYKEYKSDWIPKDVCVGDDRTKITNITNILFRCICKLIMKFPNRNSIGTGTKTVMTAGHCIYDPRAGGWAKGIDAIPSIN